MIDPSELPLISLVVPVLNEEGNIPRLYARLLPIFEQLRGRYRWELVFTDNHSTDRTFEILSDLAVQETNVRVLRFSRNFGYQRSILTGYLNAAGDAVIQLDCDMQDPPELIPQMLADWEQGWKVVYGIRRSRREGPAITWARKIFYRALNRLSDDPLPLDAGDFRLVDRRVIEELRRLDDATPYLRGMIATMGFDQKGFVYDRDARTAGSTKFGFRQLLNLALDGLLNHSSFPLRLATYCSVGILMLVGVLSFIYLSLKLTGVADAVPAGFAATALLILLSTALNAFFFGVQGEYIQRIFRQVKRPPLTIIESELNPQRSSLTAGPHFQSSLTKHGARPQSATARHVQERD